jgi:hypothetical protein
LNKKFPVDSLSKMYNTLFLWRATQHYYS